jgi:hypothetical protein
VKVGHDDEACDAGDDAKKLDAVEAADAAGEIVRDLTIEDDNGGASGKDDGA